MLKDYTETLSRLQKGLGKAFIQSPIILGAPGISVAVKVDPYHYLAVMPAFITRLAEWGGMFPKTAEEALIRTGNLITGVTPEDKSLELHVVWGNPPITKHIRASFIHADFIDRALRLHGNTPQPLPVADLCVLESDRPLVDAFFNEKTSLDKTAFSSQT